MISFNNVSFAYGEKSILNDFSLEIYKGDKICLFGDSGCGKTTVLRLLLGLEKPQKGEVYLDNGFKTSVVFQEDRLLPFKSVFENITCLGADVSKAKEMLTALGLSEVENLKPDELSGGMSRRVAIARALSLDFDFLVLDEPFTGLDSDNINTATKLINEVLGGRPLILVTHSKAEAEALGCKIREM